MWINAVSQAVHQKGANGFLHMVQSKGSPSATRIQAPTSAGVGEDRKEATVPHGSTSQSLVHILSLCLRLLLADPLTAAQSYLAKRG